MVETTTNIPKKHESNMSQYFRLKLLFPLLYSSVMGKTPNHLENTQNDLTVEKMFSMVVLLRLMRFKTVREIPNRLNIHEHLLKTKSNNHFDWLCYSLDNCQLISKVKLSS